MFPGSKPKPLNAALSSASSQGIMWKPSADGACVSPQSPHLLLLHSESISIEKENIADLGTTRQLVI